MLKKYFVFETELFSKISVWKNLKFSQQFIKLWKKSPEGVLYEKVFLEISRGLQFFKKEILAQVFSCGFCEFSKNTLFTKHLRWLFLLST